MWNLFAAIVGVGLWALTRAHEERVRKQNAWITRRRALCKDATDLLERFATDLEEVLDGELIILVPDMPYWGQEGSPEGKTQYLKLRGAVAARAARVKYSHEFENFVRMAASSYTAIWHHPFPQTAKYPYKTGDAWRKELCSAMTLLLGALEVFLHSAHVGLIGVETTPTEARALRDAFADNREYLLRSLEKELPLRHRPTPAFAAGTGLPAPHGLFEPTLFDLLLTKLRRPSGGRYAILASLFVAFMAGRGCSG